MPKRKIIPSVGEKVFGRPAAQSEMDAAVGKFIQTFSICEAWLLRVAIEYGRLDDDTMAKALLAPLRVDQGITTINRVIEVRKSRSKSTKELASILGQLGVINKMRNDLVHLGTWHGHRHDNKPYAISNKWYVHANRVARSRLISAEIILDAARDLDDIFLFFAWHSGGKSRMKSDPVMRALRETYPLGKSIPWRYKYLERKSSRPKRRGKPAIPVSKIS